MAEVAVLAMLRRREPGPGRKQGSVRQAAQTVLEEGARLAAEFPMMTVTMAAPPGHR